MHLVVTLSIWTAAGEAFCKVDRLWGRNIGLQASRHAAMIDDEQDTAHDL